MNFKRGNLAIIRGSGDRNFNGAYCTLMDYLGDYIMPNGSLLHGCWQVRFKTPVTRIEGGVIKRYQGLRVDRRLLLPLGEPIREGKS